MLRHFLSLDARRLSGFTSGEMITRMLVREARLNVIDDGVSALDEDTRKKVLFQLYEYLKRTSRSAIVATNDRFFLEAADQILFMERGQVVAQGKLARLMENEAFRSMAAQS